VRRAAAALLAAGALVVAGCAGSGGGSGTATVWVTKDRGAKVLVAETVPAGLTAMQALRRVADIDTRYGGRFVQAIEEIEGSVSRRQDWFYFVNGIEADRGAAEYRLRAGDVEWWDYRSWRGRMEQPVVVGAFPEPFLHGYGGRTRPAAVRYESPRMRGVALGLARLVQAESTAPARVPTSPEANVLLVVSARARFSAELRTPGTTAGSPVAFRISAQDGRRLLEDPGRARHRYEGLGE
jgi:hypothetical protein